MGPGFEALVDHGLADGQVCLQSADVLPSLGALFGFYVDDLSFVKP